MTTVHPQSVRTAVLTAAEGDAYVQALASVRGDLLAIPRGLVAAPKENVVDFLLEVVTHLSSLRPAASAEEAVHLDHLENLARALARAQYEFIWQSPRKSVANYDQLVAKVERMFREVEELLEQQVRRGVIRRGDAPAQKGTDRDERCCHITRLTDFLGRYRIPGTRGLLEATSRTAILLLGSRPHAPATISPTEVRDRAYTALNAAFARPNADDGERDSVERSGVFVIAHLGLPAANRRCA